MFAKIIIDWPYGSRSLHESIVEVLALNIGETSLQLQLAQAKESTGETLKRKDLIKALIHMINTYERAFFYCAKTGVYLHLDPKKAYIMATGSKECDFLEMMSNVVQIAQNFVIYEFEAKKEGEPEMN